MSRIPVTLTRVEELAGGIRRLRFLLPEHYRFTAGQYLLLYPARDADGIPFSIASAPADLPELELHYGETPGSPDTDSMTALLTAWERGDAPDVALSEPAGTIRCETPHTRRLLLIVAGTGLAQAYGIIRHLSGTHQQQPVTLFHHASTDEGLYLDPELKELDQVLPWFHYAPRIGLLSRDSNPLTNAEAWLQHERHKPGPAGIQHITDADVILCGGPDFVYTISDALSDLALHPRSLQADAFSYAPR